jgi:hypothetical protein
MVQGINVNIPATCPKHLNKSKDCYFRVNYNTELNYFNLSINYRFVSPSAAT